MVLSRRERYVAIGTIIAVAALVLDRYALTPILDRWNALDAQRLDLLSKVKDGELLVKQKPAAEETWKKRVEQGLKQGDAETKDALLHAVQNWSQDSRVTLTSVGVERAATQARTPEVTINVAAVGPWSAVARFLWDVQSSPLPVRVVQMEVFARREGADDLSLTMRLSGLYLPADWKVAPPARAPTATGGSRP
jgi:Tfp pilus assembly protein PilO